MASKKGKGQILETPDCLLILGVSDFQADPSKHQGGRLMGWKVGDFGGPVSEPLFIKVYIFGFWIIVHLKKRFSNYRTGENG